MRTHALLERLLQQMVDAGVLVIDAAELGHACMQFLAVIRGNAMWRLLFGCTDCDVAFAQEIETTATSGVEMFLRAYAPRH